MESETQRGTEPPEYFQSEKYYTMGPGIDFPLVMNYRAAEPCCEGVKRLKQSCFFKSTEQEHSKKKKANWKKF